MPHTFTLSTQSMFRSSGIVVIHSPFVDRRNIPCSAANHILYSPKFCKGTYPEFRIIGIFWGLGERRREGGEKKARCSTSSKTFLSLPLRTTIVVFGSLHNADRGPLKFGCSLSSISLI